MATPADGSKQPAQQPASYPIDAENAAEMARLVKQARLATEHTGLFPAQISLNRRQAILDIACGPGEWALSIARNYSWCHVTGIDISQIMTEYARYVAREEELYNIEFKVMDVRQPLDFPDASFDMIHMRFITGFMAPALWSRLLAECFRLLRPGGVICNTESEVGNMTTSLSFERYMALVVQGMRMAGQAFTKEGPNIGITAMQARLLQQAGFHYVQQQAHVVNISTGAAAHAAALGDYQAMLKLVQPFLVRFQLATTEDLNVLYLRAMEEMQADDFNAVSFLQTVWGEKPA